jgi:hypothetical protein
MASTPAPTKRTRRASFRLADPENEAEFNLTQHRDARFSAQTAIGSQAVIVDGTALAVPANVNFVVLPSTTTTAARARPSSRVSTRRGSVICEDADEEEAELTSASNAGAPARKKRKTKKKGEFPVDSLCPGADVASQ